MNLAEKILAAHTDQKQVSPGEFINVKVDLILANDITAPLAIKEFRRLGMEKVFDPQKLVLVPDHFVPNKDIASAEQVKLMRSFAREQGAIYFEVGQMGIEHVLLPEQGLALPGQVIIGADSHTCTYGALGAFATGMGSTDIAAAMATGEIWMKVPPTIKFVYHGRLPKWVGGKDLILFTIGNIGVDGALYSAMEFTGEAIEALSMDGRFTMANMSIEAGAKAGLFMPDGKTSAYLQQRARQPYKVHHADKDTQYARVIEYDVSQLEPQIAFPPLPSNTRPVSQVKDVSSIIIPGSQQVYLQALKEGLIESFIRAGAAVSTPTCGPCLGGHMGILAAGERCVSTTNRNFVGRMGSTKSEVYLASPAVGAASAILGRIASPEEVMA
jgi:3-isopropylmalate/(R)-2-methylmalate dehydratase large subunit